MFFSLTPTVKNNFAEHFQLGSINLYTDLGWNISLFNKWTVVFKGYADAFAIEKNLSLILDQDVPKFTGNFCVICYKHTTGEIFIKNDLWRSFPIFRHGNEITNLIKSNVVFWTDTTVSLDQDFNITEKKFDAIGHIETDTLSKEQAIFSIHQILEKKTQSFLLHNQLPIKVHLSGGVDSLLVYSYIKKQTNQYELIRASHFDYDKFWLLNDTQIKTQFWGYNQIHHWKDSCVLTSGAPGDEFMLRSPTTIDMYLKFKNMSTLDILQTKIKSLHRDYFLKDKHIEIFQNQIVDKNLSIESFNWGLCNIVINDWQHWHLGNTLTWTPLRDLEIFKIMLRLSTDTAIDQIFNSQISKHLIDHNLPGASNLISDSKNSLNPMKNLVDFLFKDFG
jgi:hypothetical protein